MKTRDSPPPVHVHVPETTPVHVHMRRSPSRTPQKRTKVTQVKADSGGPQGRAPWIPPGRLCCRRDVGSHSCQRSSGHVERGGGHQPGSVDQEEALAAVSKNLSVLLKEEENNRHSTKGNGGAQTRQADELLRALVEAEIDGVAVANQLTALKETIGGLAKEKRLLKVHAAPLGRQQDLLLEKMEIFDHTNHSLRELLREWSASERERLVWSEQKDALKKRLADSESENVRLSAKLTNTEKEAVKLAKYLDFERDSVKTTEEISRILASTRQHLDSQLSKSEAEKSQLTAQIQRLQQCYDQQHQELRRLQEELQTLKQRREEDQDQEARVQLAQQVQQAEESVRQLKAKLQEKESLLAQALTSSSDWCLRHSKEASAKGQLEEEISALKFQVTELSSQLQAAEEMSRAEREELQDQLHGVRAENTSVTLDNQRLQGQLMSSEEKLRGLQAEAHQLKSCIKKQETLVEKYKRKLQQARLKSDDFCQKLEMKQKEVLEVTQSLEREKEQVKKELLARLQELEMLPAKLRRTELQLRDAQQEADTHERRNMEHNSTLATVRHKVEQQGSQLETVQRRKLLLQEENNVLKEKNHSLERKLEDMTAENSEMSRSLTSKEASVRSMEQQLEDKAHQCSVLSRQLQQTMDDAQQQVDDSMQRVLAKERLSQSKALDLQSQLSQARSELSQLQRSKEEMERRFQAQLQNMKDRLEQSDSTNRSLQNYVHFLKTSYGNVFGESSLSS
ncbi:outer dense fiber protein 2-like [Aulostomus maculatus]